MNMGQTGILGRGTDTEPIVEEDGVTLLNCILHEIVLVGFVRRVPVAESSY